jgi:hypothetical protein
MQFLEYVLADDFESPYTSGDRFVCEQPARITYYSSWTRPRSRQRGEAPYGPSCSQSQSHTS